jgi:hypothetical protein
VKPTSTWLLQPQPTETTPGSSTTMTPCTSRWGRWNSILAHLCHNQSSKNIIRELLAWVYFFVGKIIIIYEISLKRLIALTSLITWIMWLVIKICLYVCCVKVQDPLNSL